GHLDVIKWLLNEKIAHIDEQNKAGNTALILAAAYGHTQICKVLLDSNSNINVENNLKSTALSIALSHNHLAVVDLLIRSSELRLTQSSRTHSSHSALNYYTKIVELFSQNEVDYTQILLVIKNASTQINNTELSFIYLIYHWLDINYLTRNPLPGTPQNFFADKLTIPHQAELMSHMLRTGIILTNLNQRIIYLNEEQKKSVHDWLNKSEEDSYLASKTLEAERTAVYNEFYLKLIYSALVHARGVDDSKPVNGTFLSVNLEKAIATPYSYHSDVANNVLINVDAAQWTAYHLCREGQLSVEQHSRPYKLTKGLSRRAYYNRLMLCIDNNNPNKNILLNELGDIPDINGERLRWSHNYSSWLQNISKKLSKPNTAASNGTLKLIGCDSIIHLNNGLISQIWNSQKHEPQPTALEGNHPVYHLKSQSIYCKLYPGLPGINDALHYLYRRLFSSVGGLPWSVTGLLKVDGHVIPVLLSEDSGEKLTNNDKRLDKLNTYELSKLILFSMITNPEDGKCDNYTAKQNADGTYSIFSVDNDQGLVNATVESSTVFFFTSKKLSVKTVLFCLDLMNKQLDPRAIAEFRALNPIEIVKGWLDDLVKLESEYETLFKGCRKNFAQETNPLRRVYSYVLMPIATVMNLVFKIQAIQAALKKYTSITPLFLLSTIEPTAVRYYQQVLEKKMSPTARFDELVINEKLYGYNEVTKTYSTTLTSAKELFESLVPSKQASSVSPQVALELFTRAAREWQLITEVLTKVLNGDIKQLTSLPIEEQQKLIKLIQFNQLDREKSKSLLGHLAYQEKLTEVCLHRTEKDLLNWHLSYLLKNNKLLTKLSLNNASALTTVDSLGDAQKLNYLRLINLPNIKKLKANLLEVTEVVLKDLPLLTSIDITAPKLKRLSITNCPELKLLTLSNIPVLDHLSFVKCNQLPLADFYNDWPRFISRWNHHPIGFCKKLANHILQSFPELTSINTQSVYACVDDYLNEIIELRGQLIDKISYPVVSRFKHMSSLTSAFYSAYVLAHLHYEHPDVVKTLMRCLSTFYWLQLEYADKERHIVGLIEALAELQMLNNPDVNQFIQNWLNNDSYSFLYDTVIGDTDSLDRQAGCLTEFRRRTVKYKIIDRLVRLNIRDQWFIDLLTYQSTNCKKAADALVLLQLDRLVEKSQEKPYLCPTIDLDKNVLISNDTVFIKMAVATSLAYHYQFENYFKSKFEQIKSSVASGVLFDESVSNLSMQEQINVTSDSNSAVNRPTQLSPILLAAIEGNLSNVRMLLHDNAQKATEQNSIGDSVLSLSAKNSHFAVVDYLIRYHYLGKSFNVNETKALNSLSQNNQFGLYLSYCQKWCTALGGLSV
ncbi:MAG: ankyrin repeat domain-containing protein, partial [Legionella sp.]